MSTLSQPTHETQNVEFKEAWRDEFLKWISGFANADGGTLVIGKDDQGEAVGVPDAQRLLVDIPNKVRDILGIIVDVNLRKENQREYLEIVVEPYPYPVSYKGEYHYRSGSTKQELKGAALDKFLLRKQGRHWDGVPVPGFQAGECSQAALQFFRKKAAKSERMTEAVLEDSADLLLENLQLTTDHYLKRAATLLFYDNPERFATGAYVKIGFFVTDDDLRYQDEIHGNLFEQVERTLELLFSKYLKAYISYEGIYRVETFLFPPQALREALLNAIVHKDYSGGAPLQISVYEDRIVFWNCGQLPENWTLDHLQGKHPSNPYNPLIANAFFRAGYIEAWGRGIAKINRECREHGIALPVFDYHMSGLMLTFHANPQHLIAALGEEMARRILGEKLGETRATIVETMLTDPKVTVLRLAGILNMSTTAIEKNIRYLKSQGYVARSGPAKGGHWEVLK